MSRRSAVVAGLRDAAPAAAPNVSFAMLFGATAVAVGISPAGAIGMSVLVYAGAAQMAAVELLSQDASVVVVVATVLLLNVRYVIYSASLTPHVSHLPRYWKAAIAYPLMDVNYALSVAKFEGDESVSRAWYYTGATAALVGSWVPGTAIGAFVGSALPSDIGLEFVFPLVFIGLLVPLIEDRPGAAAVIVAGGIGVVTVGVPYNLGLLVATAVGIGAGLTLERIVEPDGAGQNSSEGREGPPE